MEFTNIDNLPLGKLLQVKQNKGMSSKKKALKKIKKEGCSE